MIKFFSWLLVFLGFILSAKGSGKSSFLETVPLSDNNWILFFLGLALMGLGVIGFFLVPQKKQLSPDTKICPCCETVYEHRPEKDEKCPKCEINLEELKGFYDRHPEK